MRLVPKQPRHRHVGPFVVYRRRQGGEAGRYGLDGGFEVELKPIPGKVGVSHSHEDGAPLQVQEEQGKSSGVASAPYVPNVLADDCR